MVDGIAAIRDGRDRLGEFVRKRDRRRPMRTSYRDRPPTRRLRQGMRDGWRECERRVCGEHRREACALHQGAVFRPAYRTVVRIRPQKAQRQLLQDGNVRRHIDAADIIRDAARTIGERDVA